MRQSKRYHFDAAKGNWVATIDRKIAPWHNQPGKGSPEVIANPKFVVRPADALRARVGLRNRHHAFVVAGLVDGKPLCSLDAGNQFWLAAASGALRGYGVRYDYRYDRGWCPAWHERCQSDDPVATNHPKHAYATLVSADWAMLWVANSKPVCIVYGPRWASIESEYWRVSDKNDGKLLGLADANDGYLVQAAYAYKIAATGAGLGEHDSPKDSQQRPVEDPLLDLLDAAIAQ